MRRVSHFWIEAEPRWCWPFLFLLLPLPRAAAQLRLAGHPVQLPWTCRQSCSCCRPGGMQRWLCVSLSARTRSCFVVCLVSARSLCLVPGCFLAGQSPVCACAWSYPSPGAGLLRIELCECPLSSSLLPAGISERYHSYLIYQLLLPLL